MKIQVIIRIINAKDLKIQIIIRIINANVKLKNEKTSYHYNNKSKRQNCKMKILGKTSYYYNNKSKCQIEKWKDKLSLE